VLRLSLPAAIAVLLWVFPVTAATIHVPADQPTIQAGIDATAMGDTVLVAPGTYTGPGNRDLDFHGRDIVVRSPGDPYSAVIDCEQAGRGFYLHSGETNAARIEGLTIQNGRAPFPDAIGSGILCAGSSPVIDNCHIRACFSYDRGGGILLSGSAARISNCWITGCFADLYGGGLHIEDMTGRTEISDTSITMNEVYFDGAGVCVWGTGELVLSGCSLAGNEAGAEFGSGGGVSCFGPDLQISMSDCQFVRNTVASASDDSWSVAEGGGLYARVASVTLERCAFEGNAARGVNDDTFNDAYGGGAYIAAPQTTISNCDFSDNDCAARSDVSQGRAGLAFGGGIFCETATITNCRFFGNVVTSLGGTSGNRALGGGVYGDDVALTECVFLRNGVLAGPPNPYQAAGGGAALAAGARVQRSTFAENWATTAGSGLHFREAGAAHVENTIVALGGFSPPISCAGASPVLNCADLFLNAGGDWVGCVAGQAGMNGNMSADPLFCNLAEGDLGLAANSPCAPGNSPGQCGLIGALPIACGVIGVSDAVVPATPAHIRIFPNPIDGPASLEWTASGSGPQVMKLYDLAGRLVRNVDLGIRGPGRHHAAWSDLVGGSSLAAGVYFVALEPGAGTSHPVRVVIMK